LSIWNNAMNMGTQITVEVPTFISFLNRPRSGVAGSQGDFVFDYLKNHYVIFYSRYASLHYHYQFQVIGARVLISFSTSLVILVICVCVCVCLCVCVPLLMATLMSAKWLYPFTFNLPLLFCLS
jgi:hypothetical protein